MIIIIIIIIITITITVTVTISFIIITITEAEWFTLKPAVPEKISVCVFKVTGETNTDDLSPAQDSELYK